MPSIGNNAIPRKLAGVYVIEEEQKQRAARRKPGIEDRRKHKHKRREPDHVLRANARRKNEEHNPRVSE